MKNKLTKSIKTKPVYIRMPMYMYEQFIKTAKAANRTMSAEIVYRLKDK